MLRFSPSQEYVEDQAQNLIPNVLALLKDDLLQDDSTPQLVKRTLDDACFELREFPAATGGEAPTLYTIKLLLHRPNVNVKPAIYPDKKEKLENFGGYDFLSRPKADVNFAMVLKWIDVHADIIKSKGFKVIYSRKFEFFPANLEARQSLKAKKVEKQGELGSNYRDIEVNQGRIALAHEFELGKYDELSLSQEQVDTMEDGHQLQPQEYAVALVADLMKVLKWEEPLIYQGDSEPLWLNPVCKVWKSDLNRNRWTVEIKLYQDFKKPEYTPN